MVGKDDDPVLQNNTLRTVDFWEGGQEGYRKFKKIITEGNEKLTRK